MRDFLESDEGLQEFLLALESGTLPRAEWTHAAHIAAGTVFTRRYGANVLPAMRAAIQRHNASVGTPPDAYHETLTIFWLAIIAEELTATPQTNDLAAVRRTIARFGSARRLHEEHYTFDVVASPAAHATWIAPDAKPLNISFLLTPS